MGIGLLAFGLVVFAAGCTSGINRTDTTIPTTIDIADELEEVAEETTADEPPSVADGPELSIEAMHITDASAALTIITMVPDPSQPMILAFGELHDFCLSRNDIPCVSVQTTASHFAEEIFPLLSQPQYGAFQDHVSEFFRSDPVVERQLVDFRQGASFESLDHLDDFMRNRDFCSIFSLLQTAREDNVIVHGTHLSLAQLAYADMLWSQYGDSGEDVSATLGNNAFEALSASYNQRHSISAYGGVAHFDPDPEDLSLAVNVGPRLFALAGDNYRAVAIIVPEIAGRDSNVDNHILTRLGDWQQYIPADGLTLLMTRVNSRRSLYYIIYPRTPETEIQPLSREDVYSCLEQPLPD